MQNFEVSNNFDKSEDSEDFDNPEDSRSETLMSDNSDDSDV